MDERAVLLAERIARIRVGVDRDDVLPLGPEPGVLPLPERHEVGRHRDVRAVPGDDVALGEVALQQRVGREPLEVENLRGVLHVVRAARRQDLVPVAVSLAPEGGAPGLVEGVERAVSVLEPAAEGGLGLGAPVVGAVLVVDVPHPQGRVAGVAGGEALGDGGGVAAVRRAGVGEVLAGAPPLGPAVLVAREDLGVQPPIQGGGEEVGVARTTPMPPSCIRSISRSSRPNSLAPGCGSSSAQEKTPRVTELTPASFIRRTSSCQVSSGHCSGL